MKQKLLNLQFLICAFSICITNAQNTISITTDPFGGTYDVDGVHQISTIDYGDFTFLTTDDGLSTSFASLTPITGNLNRGLIYGPNMIIGAGDGGIGYFDNRGNGQNGYWFVFARNDGGEFKLTQLDIRERYNAFSTIEVIGFLDGAQVVAEDVTFNSSLNNPNKPITSEGFQNIDEIRIRQKTAGFYNQGIPGQDGISYNNIVIDDAVTLGIEDYNLTTISMYPNPAQNSVTINTEIKMVSIFDVTGKKVMERYQNTVDVSKLHSGMYLLKIIADNGDKVTKRLIKE